MSGPVFYILPAYSFILSVIQVVQEDPKCRALAFTYCWPIHSCLQVVQGDPKCRGFYVMPAFHSYLQVVQGDPNVGAWSTSTSACHIHYVLTTITDGVATPNR